MPKDLEARLRASARQRGLTEGSERWRAYVYGTMRRIEADGEESKHDENDRRPSEES